MFDVRIKKLQIDLSENKIDALLVSSPINIHYLTGYGNFSKAEREAFLFITKTTATLFTDPRYIEAVEKVLPSNIKATIQPLIKTLAKSNLAKQGTVWHLGFEENLTFAEYKRFKEKIQADFVLTHDFIENYRSIKDADEIQIMKRAAKLTDDTFDFIKPLIKTGVTEKQIAFEIEMYIKKFGGELAFDSIVAFGPNSSIPHHLSTDYRLRSTDEFIKLDFGAKVDGYCCDMTRTILTKSASNKAKKIYDTVLAAQTAAIEFINNKKTGYKKSMSDHTNSKSLSAKQITDVANKIIKNNGFPEIPHGLGHGVGLEVHEAPTLSPRSEDNLYNGMVFTIEPGIYLPAGRHGIPGFGGVRIEDTFLFTNGKLQPLTHSPK